MARIEATGSYLPKKRILNDIFKIPENQGLSSGIHDFFSGVVERRHSNASESGVSMGVKAAINALKSSNYSKEDIDMLVGIVIPNENLYGEDLNLIGCELGLKNASVLPINTTCSSFLSALNIANAYIEQGLKNCVMVLTSVNWVRHILREQDQIYSFAGDGAAAVILDSKGVGLIDVEEINNSDPKIFRTMCMKNPVFTGHKEYFEIQEVKGINQKKDLISSPIEVARNLLNRNPDVVVDKVFMHQAGIKMMHYWLSRLDISKEKLRHTLTKYANMTASNIPVSLDYWQKQGDLKRNDMFLMFSPATGGHYIAMLWQF